MKGQVCESMSELVFPDFYLSDLRGRFGNHVLSCAGGICLSSFLDTTFTFDLSHPHITKFKYGHHDKFKPPCKGSYQPSQNGRFDLTDALYDKKEELISIFSSEEFQNYFFNTFHECVESLQKFLNIKNDIIDEETLVVHVRGGDIYRYPHLQYQQAPVSFLNYLCKLSKKVLFVVEDMSNPGLQAIKNLEGVTIQCSDIENDYSTLVNAKKLALIGHTTFSESAALMNKNCKELYVTNLNEFNNLFHKKKNLRKIHMFDFGKSYDIQGKWGTPECYKLFMENELQTMTVKSYDL